MTLPDYLTHLPPETDCPTCGELLDGPFCPHDWGAIARSVQRDVPEIRIDMKGTT